MRFLLLDGQLLLVPLLVCWALLLTSWFAKELWQGPLEELLQSYKLEHGDMDGSLGTYIARDHELTYYNRRCDHRDISTHDANDLLIDPAMSKEERKTVIMTHGAVVMKDIIGQDTAQELRQYLEGRHTEFHANNLKLPWHELFWDGDNGSRLSLGLGPEDSDIVAKAISELGSNTQLKKTLEATLGLDPAVVEVSTLSTMHNAEPQGIHTDSDFFGSSVMYTRSFLHSYTMFIALQDTTSKMGATTLCPGTHWCADEDLEELCQCDYLDDNDDEDNEENRIGYCNTFEASSNGQTGLEVGVLQRGDAMMFNQNVWHRGPRNYDLDRMENRVMFILTFVSRRDFDRGDNREQGWGTYYYMRHNMWGHLFSDLKTAASGGMDLVTKRIWKAYGLLPGSKNGNLTWLEHWARQIANDMDFFRFNELDDFQQTLRESTNPLTKWLFLDDVVLRYLFGSNYYNDNDGDNDGDENEPENYDIGWMEYLGMLVDSAVYQTGKLHFLVVAVTAMANCGGYLAYCIFWYCFLRRRQKQTIATTTTTANFSSSRRPKPIRDISSKFGTMIFGHFVVLGIAMAVRHYVLYEAPLFKRIHNGDVHFKPFPPVQTRTRVMYEYDEEEEERRPVSTYEVDMHPADILMYKQEHEQNDFLQNHPTHPYQYYFDKEQERQQEQHRKMHRRLLRQQRITKSPSPPVQATAFPERTDVLIGTRYDADFLASMNDMLDFHPGNKEWIGLMNEFKNAGAVVDSRSNIGMIADIIVSKMIDGGPEFSSVLENKNGYSNGGVPPRFLKQDYETGWWITMTRTEAIKETRFALLALAHPKSVGLPYKYWKQVLAESRFGKKRHTVMAKTWIPRIVESSLTDLFNDVSSAKKRTRAVSPMPTTTGAALSGAQHHLLPSTGRNILPKSLVSGTTALSCSRSSIDPTVTPFRTHLKELTKDVITLKIGDHILVKGTDEGNPPYQATIVDIDAEEEELEIQPLEAKSLTKFVHIDDIQLYRPIHENDFVWALTENPDTDTLKWKIYEVMFVTPFGIADILLTQDFIDEEDENDEDFENVQVAVDIRYIFLDERHVPAIRLRQYY